MIFILWILIDTPFAQCTSDGGNVVSFDALLDTYMKSPDKYVGESRGNYQLVDFNSINTMSPVRSEEYHHLINFGKKEGATTSMGMTLYTYRLTGESVEITLRKNRYMGFHVALYADGATAQKYQLPFGLTKESTEKDVFERLRSLNLIWDTLTDNQQESLRVAGGSVIRKETQQDVEYAASIPVRALCHISDSNGYSKIGYRARSSVYVSFYFFKEKLYGFVIGSANSMYFPRMYSSDIPKIPGPFGDLIMGQPKAKAKGR